MSHVYNLTLSSEELDTLETLYGAVRTSRENLKLNERYPYKHLGYVIFTEDNPFEEVLKKIMGVR